jgi:transporter family protein
MDKWIAYALVSMLFAGATSVVAKAGLDGISGELGLSIRTGFVFVFVMAVCAMLVPRGELSAVSRHNVLWLGISAVTTTLSWVFYYKALKAGEVSTIALIDKGSFVVAVLLAWFFLKEQITLRVVLGSVFIITGLVIVARK